MVKKHQRARKNCRMLWSFNKSTQSLDSRALRILFSFLEDAKIVNSLADFLLHINETYNCEGFKHLLPIVSNDIVTGFLTYIPTISHIAI